jgi:hypothetical protein
VANHAHHPLVWQRIYFPVIQVDKNQPSGRLRVSGSPSTGDIVLDAHLARKVYFWWTMKISKDKFDAALGKLLKAKPVPRTSIKATGKRGSKKPILSKP